jgi:two-component system response regulator
MNRCILALESDKHEIYQLQRAIQVAGITDRLTVVRNYEEAICYLKGAGVYSNRDAHPMPDLMLIDVVAEACRGLEVIAFVKAYQEFSKILIVATGRNIANDTAKQLFDSGVKSVFQKPGDLEQLSDLIKSLISIPDGNVDQQARA